MAGYRGQSRHCRRVDALALISAHRIHACSRAKGMVLPVLLYVHNGSLSGCWLTSQAARLAARGGKAARPRTHLHLRIKVEPLFGPFAMLDLECAYVTVWRLVMNQLKGLHDRAELIEPWVGVGSATRFRMLETDWPVGAAGKSLRRPIDA
jgi:hypothetical protein